MKLRFLTDCSGKTKGKFEMMIVVVWELATPEQCFNGFWILLELSEGIFPLLYFSYIAAFEEPLEYLTNFSVS